MSFEQGPQTFGQFGTLQKDNDPNPHGQQPQEISLFNVGATVDISSLDPSAVTLPEGIYNFLVTKVELSDHFKKTPDAKIPDCIQMTVNLKLLPPSGQVAFSRARFFLCSNQYALKTLRDFYVSIGVLDKNAKTMTITNDVVGKYGRAKFKVHNWTDGNGQHSNNEVAWFLALDPDDPVPGMTSGGNANNLPF